jgi:hypothetical protein
MTDLRARLAEGAQNLIAKHNDGYAPPREQIEQVIAAVLSLPDIAIVELPQDWSHALAQATNMRETAAALLAAANAAEGKQ